jgi:hypothetical protein
MLMRVSETYRSKALICEKLARDAANFDIKSAWSDIAIEWHTLASRTALDASEDCELEYS